MVGIDVCVRAVRRDDEHDEDMEILYGQARECKAMGCIVCEIKYILFSCLKSKKSVGNVTLSE